MGQAYGLVQGVGFEPTNPKGVDLQSTVFDHFTNPAYPFTCFMYFTLHYL
jgi:hypothetical protein